MDQEFTPAKILAMGINFWTSKALFSAVELGIFTELASGPLDCQALMERINIHPRKARDFFDALVALKLLKRSAGMYSNTAETDLFLDKEKHSYVGGILEMYNARLYPFWGTLTEGLRTGKPQNEIKTGSGSIFDNIYADPVGVRNFVRSMTGLSKAATLAIAQKFPWQKYKTFVDVGTAEGDCAVQIARRNENTTGVGFDLPPVRPAFDEYIRAAGLQDRLRFHGGDFFKDDLPGAEVIIMGHILHDWSLHEKQILIQKAYNALPKDGALIVYELIIDDDRRENAAGLLMSLNMLIETSDGFDYTGADCASWMQAAGFRRTYTEHLTGPESMVVGIK